MKYDICIIGGAGHVGLPLSIAFAKKGKKVLIHDINKQALKNIEKGVMPFMEEGAEEALKSVIGKNLFTTSDLNKIKNIEYVIVVIGTPVDEHLNPKYHDIKQFFADLLRYLSNGQIVVLRSTVYPGVSEKIRNFLKKKHKNIEVCFCPERILEGKAMIELNSLPQIVSGFSKKSIEKASGLFSLLTEDILVVSPLEAELAKLFTNSWRYVLFAIANQFYMIAEDYGADFKKIYTAMKYKYPRTKDFPSPGFTAGPCLFKDTMQISAFTNNKYFLGHSAMLINEGLPDFIMGKLKSKYDLSKKTIGILGMAFKAESDDNRESLSYKLKKISEMEAKDVFCSDVYIKDPQFVNEKELLKKSDIIIIGAPHKRYRDLNYKNKILIDIWNIKSKGEK
jgi:UDP-N-acetyl-D-mannosaminuronic acid dehydrogenase